LIEVEDRKQPGSKGWKYYAAGAISVSVFALCFIRSGNVSPTFEASPD
jgi:hypothetical protein